MEGAVQAYGKVLERHDLFSHGLQRADHKSDLLVLQTSLSSEDDASVNKIDFSDLYKSLTVTGRNIIDKLNELLKKDLPQGIQSLKPEEVTPDATAERIVKGSTAFYSNFAKQHPELEGEELLEAFMKEVRSGVKQGYESASSTLKDLGAFEFEGVQEGISKTMELVEEKLKAFEEAKRKELGLSSNVAQQAQAEFLKQSGGSILERPALVQ